MKWKDLQRYQWFFHEDKGQLREGEFQLLDDCQGLNQRKVKERQYGVWYDLRLEHLRYNIQLSTILCFLSLLPSCSYFLASHLIVDDSCTSWCNVVWYFILTCESNNCTWLIVYVYQLGVLTKRNEIRPTSLL